MNRRYSFVWVAVLLIALWGLGKSRKTEEPPIVGVVEYANVSQEEPAPRSYIVWPLNSPFFLGNAGQVLSYTLDGSTLTIHLAPEQSATALQNAASVQVFRRGPLAEQNFQAVMFYGPAYFVGRAGDQLPTVYDAENQTLTVTLPQH